MDAAHTTRPRLGRVLVDAGLLTEEQLEAALKEQTQSGRRLGEIVVERGYLSGPALANALATQHGGVVRTEYGIATGLGTPAASRVSAASPEVTSPPPASGSEVAPESAPQAQAEPEPASEPAQTLSLLHVLEDWSGLLEDLREKVARLEAELGATRTELQATKDEFQATRLDLEATKRSLESTTETLVAAKQDLDEARGELRATREQLVVATNRLQELERAQAQPPAAEPRREEETPPAEPPAPVPVVREVQIHRAAETANGERAESDAQTHLMSVPTPTGFVLLERSGPTPAVGTQVRFEEEPDARFVVTKVNVASDLNPRPCAFLERL